jgi:hypothetical protein
MKKTLIAVAALAATSAFAQVTLSGSFQAGLVNSGGDGASTAVTHLGNGTNAINLSASEDLGKGMRAGVDGQIRFNATNGDRNSSGNNAALFHNLNTFVSGAFGTARIGKIAEASNCAYDPWACGGGAAMMAGNGVNGLIGAGAMAQAIGYTSPTMMGFTVGLQKSQGTRVNERSVAHVNYANGPLTAQVMVTSGLNSTTVDNPTAANTAAAADIQHSQTGVAAAYDFKWAKFNLTNVTSKGANDQKYADITTVSAVAPLGGPLTLLAGYSKSKTGLTGTPPTGAVATALNDTKFSVGVNYALSRRTTLGADLFKAEGTAAQAPATGTAGMGYVLRARHTF